MAMSGPLVELSDMNVVRDINYQGLLIEHVKHQEDGLVIKLYVKVGVNRIFFMITIRGNSYDACRMVIVHVCVLAREPNPLFLVNLHSDAVKFCDTSM